MCKYASQGQGTINKIIEMKNITETFEELDVNTKEQEV